MSVELEPSDLGFRRKCQSMCRPSVGSHLNELIGPFDREVTETLRLRNSNSDPVAFKVCIYAVIVLPSFD